MPFKNHEDHKAYQREYKRKLRLKRKERLDDIKSSSGCQSCGVHDHPSCMDFHHENEEEKEINLSGFEMYSLTEKRLQEELDKCIVLCKSCHHKYHLGLLSLLSPQSL